MRGARTIECVPMDRGRERRMDAFKLVEGDYDLDCTPVAISDAQFQARAVITHRSDGAVAEVKPAFDPFGTQAEAVTAAHMAAVAWIAHQRELHAASTPGSPDATG